MLPDAPDAPDLPGTPWGPGTPSRASEESGMPQPRVGIVLGSSSDEERAQTAAVVLEKFGVDYELEVLSAAAGKAAALPGVVAAHTVLPVIGLPIFTPQLGGQDSLYSVVQMPSGVPVATVGLDAAANAGILAVQILAIADPQLRKQLHEFKHQLDEGLRL